MTLVLFHCMIPANLIQNQFSLYNSFFDGLSLWQDNLEMDFILQHWVTLTHFGKKGYLCFSPIKCQTFFVRSCNKYQEQRINKKINWRSIKMIHSTYIIHTTQYVQYTYCVTTWLIYFIILSPELAIMTKKNDDDFQPGFSPTCIYFPCFKQVVVVKAVLALLLLPDFKRCLICQKIQEADWFFQYVGKRPSSMYWI